MSIKCPKCQHPKSDVFDSRPREDGIRRRRTCQKCEHRFSTQERVFVSAKVSLTPKPTKAPSRPKKRVLTANPKPRPKPQTRRDINSLSDEEFEALIFEGNYRFDEDEL